jgi:hypothetical protein
VLSPRQMVPFNPEDAMALVDELVATEARMRRIRDGLRAVLEEFDEPSA